MEKNRKLEEQRGGRAIRGSITHPDLSTGPAESRHEALLSGDWFADDAIKPGTEADVFVGDQKVGTARVRIEGHELRGDIDLG